MKIHTVTVTGADDSTSFEEMAQISQQFPQVEFGILLSQRGMGIPRFPSNAWLSRIRELPPTVKLSGHLCGLWVREILEGYWPTQELQQIFGFDPLTRFDRWQLNTHGNRHNWTKAFIGLLRDRRIIFQNDEKHNDLILAAAQAPNKGISALFDLSHGGGALPSSWPAPLPGVSCGYAGGLSPEKVAEQCRIIASKVGDASIWIDAETRLRSNNDSLFDLDKVRRFIENAQPFCV